MRSKHFISRSLPMALAGLTILAAQAFTGAPQNVAPPPKPPDSGPSLEVTLKFITDKIGDEGRLTYSANVTDTANPGSAWNNKFEVELSNPTYDVKGCRISYHWRAQQNGKASDDKDYTLNLREVKDLAVLSQQENQKNVDSQNGQGTWDSQITPPLFALVVHRPKKVDNAFLFSDEQMANRVAKAMVHAVELCGGGNTEPF